MCFVIAVTLIVTIAFFIKEQKDWGDWLCSLGISFAAAIVTLIISSILAACFTGVAYDENKLVASTIEIPYQINGKVKGTINIANGATQADVEQVCYDAGNVEKDKVFKVIYIPNKIINFIVK